MADRDLHEVTEYLKREMNKFELSPEQCGKKCGIDRMTLERFISESNKKGPFYLTVELMSKGLGMDLSYVLRKEDTTRVDMDPAEFERYKKYKMLSAEKQEILNQILDSFFENEMNSIKND